MLDMQLDLAALRAEFPILSTSTYMISNSLGAMPRGVEASLQEYATTWATRGVRAWAERWWTMAREVGDAVAPTHRGAGRQRQHVRERHRRAHGGAVDAAAANDTRRHRVLSRRLSRR